jgi:predicted metal-dependent phosphoesterase TrpH
MEIKVQLHMHTTESRGTRIKYDSIITPKQAVDTLKKKGFHVFAITDHNTTAAFRKIKDYAEKNNLILIKGIEINTADGHLIGLGIHEGIEKNFKKTMSVLEISDIIKENDGYVYIPHPFDIKKEGLGRKIKEVDGIVEVFNSMNIYGFEDKYARYFAKKFRRPIAAGSDAHMPSMLEFGATIVDSEPDEHSILKSIVKGKVKLDNCNYMTLRDFKELSLNRVFASYSDIMEKITNGWKIDSKYMIIANNRLIRCIEKIVLNKGMKTKTSKFWDLVTFTSNFIANLYSKYSKRDFDKFILNELQSF